MIRRLPNAREDAFMRAAQLHQETFPDSYRDLSEAMDDLIDILKAEGLLFVAEEDGDLVGVIGAVKQYPSAWELHPLVVAPSERGRGVGRALVMRLESELRERGALVVYLGTDDERFATSLSEGDLFMDTFGKIGRIRNFARHPYGFYVRCGYAIVGVIPDANGFHKPDIIMAKRLREYPSDADTRS